MRTAEKLILTVLFGVGIVLSLGPQSFASQDNQPEIRIAVVNTVGDSVSNFSAYWFHDGKSKKLSPTDGHVNVAAAEGLVVVQAEGFQYAGIVLENKSLDELANAAIQLRTQSEPGREMKTLPVPISAAQKRKIGAEISKVYWDRLKANPNDVPTQMACYELLGGLDPKGLEEFLAQGNVQPRLKAMGQQFVVKALARTDPELAIETADSVTDPMLRSGILFALLKGLPSNSPHIEAIETQCVETIKAISQPAFRYAVWASLAEYYIATGRPELAAKIVQENLSEVKKLPDGGWAAYPKSLFAALVVNQDSQLAMELIKGCRDHEKTRALGRLAFYRCLANPQHAIELLEELDYPDNSLQSAKNHIKVAYRMAGTQTTAAFEVASSIDETFQEAWAWGMIAKKIGASDPKGSKLALENAVQALTVKLPSAKAKAWYSQSSTLAGLMPIAESVAPEKVESMIWHTVWLAIPRTRWNFGGGSKDSRLQDTAAALSRYDRELAKALMGENTLAIGMDVDRWAVSQVALDAEGLPEFMARLEQGPGFSGSFHPRARVAEMLTGSDDEFWNHVSLPTFLDWPTEVYEDR